MKPNTELRALGFHSCRSISRMSRLTAPTTLSFLAQKEIDGRGEVFKNQNNPCTLNELVSRSPSQSFTLVSPLLRLGWSQIETNSMARLNIGQLRSETATAVDDTMYDAPRNERYREEGDNSTFDWFRDYSQIKSLLADLIPDKDLKILMLGCGNSALSEDMYNDGFRNITNVDVRITRHYKAI
jgi:hypothetical protein